MNNPLSHIRVLDLSRVVLAGPWRTQTHTGARGIQVQVPLSGGGVFSGVASAMYFSETPLGYPVGPPILGEHTDEALTQHPGLPAEERARLRAASVI